MKLLNLILVAALTFSISSCGFQAPDYVQMISSTELNQVMAAEDVFLVDVHTPRQQHIKGTDLFIPYNEIEKYSAKLPKDKAAAIYLYCAGGPMGNSAARVLHELGYSNLVNLQGGANAWRRQGFAFE